jgi:hypothetical protein
MTFLVRLMPHATHMTNPTETKNTTQTNMPDPREIHRRAMTQTEAIVAAVQPGQLALPHPLRRVTTSAPCSATWSAA